MLRNDYLDQNRLAKKNHGANASQAGALKNAEAEHGL